MITINLIDRDSISSCEACSRKAEYTVIFEKSRIGTGDLSKKIVKISLLCGNCMEEFKNNAPRKNPDYVEIEYQGDYK